jgi:AcrR family transcriptional regulator
MDKRSLDPDGDQAWALPAHQARSREQRDRLLRAGERVFAEMGFGKAHVADIARKAGCSVGSFYRRFPDKEAFFFALQSDMAAHAEANIARFFEDPACAADSLAAVLHRLVRNSARVMQSIQGYYRALFELSLLGHEVWAPMRKLQRIEAARLADLLERRGVGLGADAEARCQLAVRMMHSQILTSLLHGPGPLAVDDPRFHTEVGLMLLRYLQLEDTSGGRPA